MCDECFGNERDEEIQMEEKQGLMENNILFHLALKKRKKRDFEELKRERKRFVNVDWISGYFSFFLFEISHLSNNNPNTLLSEYLNLYLHLLTVNLISNI